MIELNRDFRRIKRASDHPIHISRAIIYLMEAVDGEDLGVWMFHPFKDGLAVHADLNEKCRGQAAAASARNAFQWIFNHTSVNVIYAVIPPEKRHVRTLAQVVGFEFTGDYEHGYRIYRLERQIGAKRKAA